MVSEMPPHGSGIGVWVAVDKLEDDAGAPLLIVVKADLETPLLGAGVGALETATVWGARASLLWPAKAMGGTVSSLWLPSLGSGVGAVGGPVSS